MRWPLSAIAAIALHASVHASDCDNTSIGEVPLNDLGAGLYLGLFEGGLYPGGQNDVPAAHATEGLARAAAIVPRDTDGNPDPAGNIVTVSVGMSNTSQAYCGIAGTNNCNGWSFVGRAMTHPQFNRVDVELINGAHPGMVAQQWRWAEAPVYGQIRTRLSERGLSEAQVQVAWVKVASPGPTESLPSSNADAYHLLVMLGDIIRALGERYPNLQQVFLTSRTYAGYAVTQLNPEPFAYESGFAVKWLIEAQIEQMTGSGSVNQLTGDLDWDDVPWIAWGPYVWADGTTPRSDGLTWQCFHFEQDGTHPSTQGESQMGELLLAFFMDSPFTSPWFAIEGTFGDLTGDGLVDVSDLIVLLSSWGPCDACAADLTNDGTVGTDDLLLLLLEW